MFYDFTFTIPLSATALSPHEQIVNLVSGVIHRLEVAFPAGCRGAAYVQIYKGAHQVWPTNIGGAFHTENFTIVIEEAERLPAGPNQFRILGWLVNAQHPHTLSIRFGILSPEAITPFAGIGTALRKFLKLVGVK